MEARRREEEDEQGLKPLRRGWCWGIEEFRRKMLELMERKLGVGRTNLRSDPWHNRARRGRGWSWCQRAGWGFNGAALN